MTDALDFTPLARVIDALDDALGVLADKPWFDVQPLPVRNTLVSGAVQSVEFVYELAIKSLRRSLEHYFADVTPVDAMSFRTLIRTAAERGLIDQVEPWFAYRDMRNVTAHTYDRAKAQAVLAQAAALAGDARALCARLTALS
ncbi:HI0074 family nucleotidyltransferase substrate-binding subunit [Novosphingobium sp.]|uniref:HI0074 family nucleotidyltransferase substrate-binding subunit n=1 Tax=Novosphingobium sp. TaxID=1874826 RepID=UPI00334029AF